MWATGRLKTLLETTSDAKKPGFLDANRPEYLVYLELVLPKLSPGGLLIADNVVSHAAELGDYLARVKSDARLFSVTVPIGNGEEISLKLG